MNYENIAIKVRSHDNNKLVIETSEGMLRTYYAASRRMMYLYAETLQVSMRADAGYPSTKNTLEHPLKLIRQIEGTGILKGQLLSVIGDSKSPSDKLKIVFQTVTPDGRENNQGSELVSSSVPSYTRAWIKCIRLNQKFGDGPEYIAVCMVAPEALDAIASAISAKTLSALTVGMIFDNIYIDHDDEEYWMDDLQLVKEWYLRPNLTHNTIELREDAYGAVTYLDLALGKAEFNKQPDTQTESKEFINPTSSLAESQPNQHNTSFNLSAPNFEKFRPVVKFSACGILLILFVFAVIHAQLG